MSPRTSEQYREIREEKMTLIMDTALEQFAREGYYRTPISQIARHAGISKGLMYNYFESKEALLKAIVERSLNEATRFFDINRDGYLSEEEFEFFIRTIEALLKEKRTFWRLLMQLLVQSDVRQQLEVIFRGNETEPLQEGDDKKSLTPPEIRQIIADYFSRKQSCQGNNFDPVCEVNLFFSTMLGFAVQSIYTDGESNGRMIDRIIEMYK